MTGISPGSWRAVIRLAIISFKRKQAPKAQRSHQRLSLRDATQACCILIVRVNYEDVSYTEA